LAECLTLTSREQKELNNHENTKFYFLFRVFVLLCFRDKKFCHKTQKITTKILNIQLSEKGHAAETYTNRPSGYTA
jgi:hypothetical protein